MQIEVGSIVEGKITGIVAFGAFVTLEDGGTGLIHISEIASEYVDDVSRYVKMGQQIKAKVLSSDGGKLSLSMKQLEAEKKPEKDAAKPKRQKQQRQPRQPHDFKNPPEVFENKKRSGGDMSFDDMLQKFKQDSDEKLKDLKRPDGGKRSPGGYKRAY